MTDLLWNKNIMQQSYFDWFVWETRVPTAKTTVARQLEWMLVGAKRQRRKHVRQWSSVDRRATDGGGAVVLFPQRWRHGTRQGAGDQGHHWSWGGGATVEDPCSPKNIRIVLALVQTLVKDVLVVLRLKIEFKGLNGAQELLRGCFGVLVGHHWWVWILKLSVH